MIAPFLHETIVSWFLLSSIVQGPKGYPWVGSDNSTRLSMAPRIFSRISARTKHADPSHPRFISCLDILVKNGDNSK